MREALETAHLRLEGNQPQGLDFAALAQWLWMPAAGTAGVVFLAFAVVYVSVVCAAGTKARTSRASVGHSKSVRNMVRAAKMNRGMADIALQPANELIHEMAFEMQDLQTTMGEVLQILGL